MLNQSIIDQGPDLQAAAVGKEPEPVLETDEDRRRNHLRQMAAGIACVSQNDDHRADDPRHGLCRGGRYVP